MGEEQVELLHLFDVWENWNGEILVIKDVAMRNILMEKERS
jgi:hypothetical protein